MFIQIEETPNPETLKFLPGRTVLLEGTLEIKSDNDQSLSCELADLLLNSSGIKSVFFTTDFIAITKEKDSEWFYIKPSLLSIIMDYYMRNDHVLLKRKLENKFDEKFILSKIEDNTLISEESSLNLITIAKINDLLEKYIRPAIHQDGGDVSLVSFKNGIAYLEMKGACSGCPRSMATLKLGIENMLKQYIPDVVEVRSL